MRDFLNDRPPLMWVVFTILVGGIAASLIYASGENYLAEVSYIFSFYLVFGILIFIFQTEKCIYLLIITAISGAVGGAVYWYALSIMDDIYMSLVYGSLIGLLMMFLENSFSKDSCS